MAINPYVGGALVGAGASLLGGLMGSSSAKKDRKLQKYQFDQQMDYSVQRRVADAKAAGVHPLFALGASVGASPTAQVTGNAMGEGIARAGEAIARGYTERHAAKIAEAQLAAQRTKTEASAQRDYSEAAMFDSITAKNQQALMTQGRDVLGAGADAMNLGTFNDDPTLGNQDGPVKVVRPEVKASQSFGVQAGTQPGRLRVALPGVGTVDIINPDLGLDEIAQLDFLIRAGRLKTTNAIEKWANSLKSNRANVRPRGRRGSGARVTRGKSNPTHRWFRAPRYNTRRER